MQRLTTIVLATVLTALPAAAQQNTRSRADTSDQNQSARMMEDRIYSRLASSGSLGGANIDVKVNGRTAVLTGSVADEQSRERAARLARRVSGVETVQNNLTVDRAAVEKNRKVNVTDDQLSKQIAEKLVKQHFAQAEVERDWMFGWEVEGDGWEFEVDVDGGDVTLSGNVPRPAIIGQIIRTTRTVPGVRTVTSELRADMYYRPYGDWPYYWGYHPYPF
jgi:osmotically-inducible protein OsmY